ncbi:MAG: type III pantothenate kinase, partial [Candidatus Binatia bacterium]
MLLAIDVSNTHTKLGVYDRERLVQHWRVQTLAERTSDEYAALLLGLFTAAGLPPTAISGVIVSSVVPPINQTIEDLARKFFGHPALWVGPGIKTGMPILYDNPKEVGADRIVNAVAAYERVHTAAIVIDFGTATTFDYVTMKGEYAGGVIVPGIGISLEALGSRTAKLPKVDFRAPERLIGTNTVASIQAGLYYGAVGMIDGLLERLVAEMGPDTR